MAGGALSIGYAPDSEEFRQNFDWPEAVVRLPEEPAEAAAAVGRLLDNPGELDRMRSVNLSQVAIKHDWLHRWELILNHFGLPHTEEMVARRQDLVKISESNLPSRNAKQNTTN